MLESDHWRVMGCGQTDLAKTMTLEPCGSRDPG